MPNPVDTWASTLLDTTTDIIQIFDRDGRYAFINNAGRRLFARHGIDAGALIGKKVFEDIFDTPRGGRISVEAECRGDGASRSLELRVRDNGAGIAADLLPRVFGLFVQGQDAQAAKGGLGIGLALARQLVELHGGRIEAHSDGPGTGSTFIIRMPVVLEPRVAIQQVEAAPATTPATRVLIADDNVDAAEMLAAFVGIKGATAYIANDGAEAVRIGADVRPDLILLDIGMPGMDGYEACRQLRASPFSSGAFIVALTGWGQDQDKQRARQSGFDAHLTKPADLDVVAKMLAQVSRGRDS